MQILSQYQQIHADTCTYLHSHGCPALQFASVARGWLGTPSHRSGCLNTGVLDLLGFRTVTTASAAAGTHAAAVGARALHVHVRPRTWKLAVSVTVTVTAPGPSNDGPWRRTATRAKPAMLHLMNQSWPVSQYCPLAAAVGPDRTANKDQPYQYSKSSLDDSAG